MSTSFDVIVVGGGAMGTSAARHLAMRGRRTLLLERYTFGHANGSSGGPTRIFRFAYEEPWYVRLAALARPTWDELQEAAGERLMSVTGNVDVGPTSPLRADRLEAAGLIAMRMSQDEARERWPSLRLPSGADILFQPEGGVLRAERTVQVQARLALEAGADIRQGTAVLSVQPSDGGVSVVTDQEETFDAPVAVVSVGAWAGPLLRAAGVDLPLRPSLEQSSYFRIGGLERTTHTEAPPAGSSPGLPTVMDWAIDVERPAYLVPDPFASEPGQFKAGLHHTGPAVEAETRTLEPDSVRVEAVGRWVAAHILGAVDLVRTDTCLYTVTPDEDFVLDRIGPLVVASPCSGHGFKFAPLFGAVLADLATGRRSSIELERFALDRPGLRSPVRRRDPR